MGKGLGKDGQGMSSALMVEKTSRRGGKIIHERDRQKGQQPTETSGAQVQEQASSFGEITIPTNATAVCFAWPNQVYTLLKRSS